MPCGSPEGDEAVAVAAQHGGVERAAAEVVDGDDVALVDPLAGGVVHGGGLRLGDEARVAARRRGAAACREQLDLVRPPVGGVGDDDRRSAGRPSAR